MKALVVDGYNAIHKIAHLEAMLDISLHEARRALTELAMEYKRKVGGISEVSVVFDGKDTYRRQEISAPPNQVFSRSGEGDRTIIRTVERLSNRYHVVVVSDDNFVRNNSRAHRASIITISEFLDTVKTRKPQVGKKNQTS